MKNEPTRKHPAYFGVWLSNKAKRRIMRAAKILERTPADYVRRLIERDSQAVVDGRAADGTRVQR